MNKGWAKVINIYSNRRTSRYHYYKEGASLCGKYIIDGSSDKDFINENWMPMFNRCNKCLELLSKK